MVRRMCIVCAVLAIVLVHVADAQTVRITANKTAADPNEQVIFTVEIEAGSEAIFGAALEIDFGPGFELIGDEATDIVIDSRWLASVKKMSSATVMELAVTAGGAKPPCTGTCLVARINGRYTSEGRKNIIFDEFDSTARSAPGLGHISFQTFEEPIILIGSVEFFPADNGPSTGGNFEIEAAEASTYAQAFLSGDPNITPSLASRFAQIFLQGGCYTSDLNDSVGWVPSACE